MPSLFRFAWLSRHIRLALWLYGGFRLDLEQIAFPRNHFVQHGIDEESDEEARDETSHDDYGEGPLSIRSNAGRKSRWQQSKAGNKSRHHDGTEPQERSLPCGSADTHSLLSQLVDVGDENDGSFHRNPK